MNRDLLIGLVVSVALHCTFLLGFNRKAPPAHKDPGTKETLVQFDMPPIEEEKEEKVEELNDEPIQNQLAPPSLVDMPTVVPVTAFLVPLTPPPPPGLTPSKGAITIPVNKPGANFGQGIKDLFNVSDLDQQPVLRVHGNLNYPYEMQRAGISGTVLVEFIINKDGDVVQAQVIRSPQREFEAPALQSILKSKFKPGRRGGHVVNVRAQQPIEFKLDDK